MGRMTLAEAFERLHEFPADGVIYAARIDGRFLPTSDCAVLRLSDEQLQLPVSAIARKFAPGMHYFLEVEMATPFAERARSSDVANEAALQRLIQYAENDA